MRQVVTSINSVQITAAVEAWPRSSFVSPLNADKKWGQLANLALLVISGVCWLFIQNNLGLWYQNQNNLLSVQD